MSAVQARFLAEPLSPEVAAALARLAATPDVVRIAVMPDVHLADEVCVGTVVATRRLIYPAAVGGDLGCGVAALRFAVAADDVLGDARAAARALAGLYRAVPRDRQRRAALPPWPAEQSSPAPMRRLPFVSHCAVAASDASFPSTG